MKTQSKVSKLTPLQKRAEAAFKIAVAKAIDEHARLGFPIYIWRNGRVVELSPEEIRGASANPEK